MLAYNNNGTIEVWNGEPVNGYQYQCNIDECWTDVEMAAVGIYRVQEFVIPSGYNITTDMPTYTLNGNIVVQTYQIIPVPAPVTGKGTVGASTVVN
jgi:hypothetical protein